MHPSADADLARAIDMLFTPHFHDDTPGAAVIVTRDGEPVFRRGYGMANLEHGVPASPETVFRIASITKQFTAAAILLLVQDGKLTPETDITAILPDYPTHGRSITVEHLLTHTSGIPSYTGMSEWLPRRPVDLSLRDLVDMFKDKPLEFEPGERWSYNNSAYILLGVIIETLAGMPYAQFMEERIFRPLGMARTSYDDTARIIPGRAAGYDRSGDTWQNTAYLSMTHPHAAGALVSTVDDLARWDAALSAGTLVGPELLERAWAPYRLASGKIAHYGYGWGISVYEGRRTMEHSGGINGFTTYALRMPDERLFVAVLTNGTSEPSRELLAVQVAGLAIGRPYRAPVAVTVEPEALASYTGVYEVDARADWVVRLEDGELTMQHTGRGRDKLYPLGDGAFFTDHPFLRVHFVRDAGGAVSALQIHGREGLDEEALRTSRPIPVRTAIALAPELAAEVVGTYQMEAGFTLAVTAEEGRLFAQAGGQPRSELLAESETSFFLADVDAAITFERDEAGAVAALELQQGPMRMRGVRVRHGV